MVNYSNSKIYKIVDNTNGNIYIGSTVKTLAQRLAYHRQDYKRYLEGKQHYITSFKILENDNYDIILLEECKDCENKEQLHARERHYIDTLQCVNKVKPTRTKKEYYEEHKEHLNIKQKEYYELNKEHLYMKKKEYIKANKDKFIEYHKDYYNNNKEVLSEKRKTKYICPHCNMEIRLDSKIRHEKSIKHLSNIKNC